MEGIAVFLWIIFNGRVGKLQFLLILFLLFLMLLPVPLLLLTCELAICSGVGGSVESMVLAPMECLVISLQSSLASSRSFLLPGDDLVLLLPFLPLLLLLGLVSAILVLACWRALSSWTEELVA